MRDAGKENVIVGGSIIRLKVGMFQGTICPSEGGEAKDFVPPPKGAERSKCFALSIIPLHFGLEVAGIAGHTQEERAKTVLDHFQKVQLSMKGNLENKIDN